MSPGDCGTRRGRGAPRSSPSSRCTSAYRGRAIATVRGPVRSRVHPDGIPRAHRPAPSDLTDVDARSRHAPGDRPRPPVRGVVGDPEHGPRGAPRRGPRAARPQRRRQDHDGPAAHRADRAERGARLGRRPRRDRACRGGSRPGRDPDRDTRALRQAVGARQPRLLRPALRARCRARARRGSSTTCGSSRSGSGGTTLRARSARG